MSKFGIHNSKSAKLSPSQVLELRQRYRDGWTQGALARLYQISVGQVGRICRGESWQGYQNPAAEPTETEIEASMRRVAHEQGLLRDSTGDKPDSKPLDEFLSERVKGYTGK